MDRTVVPDERRGCGPSRGSGTPWTTKLRAGSGALKARVASFRLWVHVIAMDQKAQPAKDAANSAASEVWTPPPARGLAAYHAYLREGADLSTRADFFLVSHAILFEAFFAARPEKPQQFVVSACAIGIALLWLWIGSRQLYTMRLYMRVANEHVVSNPDLWGQQKRLDCKYPSARRPVGARRGFGM